MHESLSWPQRLGVSLLDSIIPHNYQPHAGGMLLVQYFATVGVFSVAQRCALMVPAKDPRSLHPVPQQGSVQPGCRIIKVQAQWPHSNAS
jgi:hypothetical protein